MERKKTATPKQQSAAERAAIAEEKITLEEERIFRRGVVGIRELVAPAVFEISPTRVRCGELLPHDFCHHLSALLRHRLVIADYQPEPVARHCHVFLSDQGRDYFETAQKESRRPGGAKIISDAEKGAARDPLRETALRDIEQLRDDLTQGTEHFFQFGFHVTIYAHSVEELDKISEEIDSAFGSKLIYSKRVFYQAEQGFNSTMPLGNDELQISFNMNSSPIASSFPFISSDLTSDTGVLFGINRHNNSLIIFDRFSLQNANMVVFATSGAGKSYAVKLEILRSLMMGTDVIVIDPEMEYRHLSDAVAGTYINISLSSESKLNPFDLPRPVGRTLPPKTLSGRRLSRSRACCA